MEQSEIMDISKPVHKIVVVTKTQPQEEFYECHGPNYSSNESSNVPKITNITREVQGSTFGVKDFTMRVVPVEKSDNFVSHVEDNKVVIKINTGKSGTSFQSFDALTEQKQTSGHKDVLGEACAEIQCGYLMVEERDFNSVEKDIVSSKMQPCPLPMMTEPYGICSYLHDLEAEMHANQKVCELEGISSLCNKKSVCKQAMDVPVNLDVVSHFPQLHYKGVSEFEPPTFPVMCNTITSALESTSVSSSSSSCMQNANFLNYTVPISCVTSNNAELSNALISDNFNSQCRKADIADNCGKLKPAPTGFKTNNKTGDSLYREKQVESLYYSSLNESHSSGNKEMVACNVYNSDCGNTKDQSETGGTKNMTGSNSNVINDNQFARIGNVGEAEAIYNNYQSHQINSTNQAENVDSAIEPSLPLKYTISVPDRPFFTEMTTQTSNRYLTETFIAPPPEHSLHQINSDEQIRLSLAVENKLLNCAQRFKCHPTALANARFIYRTLEESGSYFPFSTEEKIVSSLVYGGIASKYPLVLSQKLRRTYRLQFTLPILVSIVIPENPELPIDLDPRAYLGPLMTECGLADDDIKKHANNLLMSLHTLEYRETGMSQQWAVAALLRTIRMSKRSRRDVVPKLKNYSKSIKVLDYTIKRLAKMDSVKA